MILAEPMESLGVVPLVANLGGALLPAILAPIISALALLVRPRELAKAVRRRPGRTVVTLAVLGVAVWGIVWMAKTPAQARATGAAGEFKVDWTRVALTMIEREGGEGEAALGLRREWQFNPIEGAMFLATPVVRDGRVYAASAQTGATGGMGVVYCVDATDGREIWRLERFEDRGLKPIFSSPALTADGKWLLIGEGLHFDSDSRLLCINAETGKLKWRIQTPLHVESSPAIHGDVVVVGAGSIEGSDRKPRGHPGLVIAARISDGKKLWEHQVNDPESSPAISGDGAVAYIGSGFQGNAVVALRTASDEELKSKGLTRELWRTAVPYPVTGAVTLAGEMAIVGGGNSDYVNADRNPLGVIVAIDAKTGQKRWEKMMPDAVLGKIAAKDGVLICAVRDGTVVALKQSNGEQIWIMPVSGKSPVLAGCAFTGKHVYAVSNDGYVAVMDAADGRAVEDKQMVNSDDLPGELGMCLSAPVVVGARVYVGSETGGLRCFSGGKGVE